MGLKLSLTKGEWLKRSEDVMSSVLLLSHTRLNCDPFTPGLASYMSNISCIPHTLCLNPLCYSHQTHPWHTVEESSVAACLGINKATDTSEAEPRGWCLSSAQSRRQQLEPVVLLNTFITPLCKNFHRVLGSNKSNIKSFPTSKTEVWLAVKPAFPHETIKAERLESTCLLTFRLCDLVWNLSVAHVMGIPNIRFLWNADKQTFVIFVTKIRTDTRSNTSNM